MLVAVEATAINPSNVASAEGRFDQALLPRFLGDDFAGRVCEGPADLIGQDVWGSGGDLDIWRDGTHAEYLAIPRDAVALRPRELSVEEAAAVGVPFQTAWAGLIEIGAMGFEPRPGRGAAAVVGGHAVAPGRGSLLDPQQNQVRNRLDTSGLWQFQLDAREEGEAQGWFKALPAPRPIAVPCSWNDLFDDARNYLGLAWYSNEVWVPSGWRGQRVFLRVGSANYAATVWVNGMLVAQHLGGHLPFVTEVTSQLV